MWVCLRKRDVYVQCISYPRLTSSAHHIVHECILCHQKSHFSSAHHRTSNDYTILRQSERGEGEREKREREKKRIRSDHMPLCTCISNRENGTSWNYFGCTSISCQIFLLLQLELLTVLDTFFCEEQERRTINSREVSRGKQAREK